LGIEPRPWQLCLEDPATLNRIREDVATASALNIAATPFFLIGLIEAGGVRVKRIISGARPVEDFVTAVDAVLAEAGK